MRDVRKLNALLWAVNVLLIAGTVAFAFRYLLKQQRYLADFVPDAGGEVASSGPTGPVSDASLRIGNPVEPKSEVGSAQAVLHFKAKLHGTLPSEDPKSAVAFLRSMAGNAELVAYVAEPILQEGKVFDEYRGWTLQKVEKDRATFAGPNGLTQELVIDASSGPSALQPQPGGGKPVARMNRAGQAYVAQQFRSKVLAQTDSRQVWQIDPAEMEWAAQNLERMMETELKVSPNGGGGVRLESVAAGTIGASRGLMTGDVVRDVNGQPLNSLQDFRNLMNNPAFRQASGLRVTVERGGKPMVIEYRQLPK